MKRGINFHHLLNWPDVKRQGGKVEYAWPPFRSANYQIGDGELGRLKAMGFDFVRLTVDPSIVITTPEDRWGPLKTQMRELVQRLASSGFPVVFDLHPVAVNPEFKPEILIDRASPDAFRRYADSVERVAAMLDGLPPDRVAFELMNEPWISNLAETPRWLAMQEQLHARARAKAPQLPLVLTGVQWSSFQALVRVDTAPYRSSNVLYTFHYYDPHTYTHQGVAGETQYLSGLTWPTSRDNVEAAQAKAAARIADAKQPADRTAIAARTKQLLDNLQRTGHGPDQIARDFDAVAQWASRNGVSPDRILLGEFGCVVSAQGEEVGPSRLAWLKAVRSAAEQKGFAWAYWAYKGYGGMELVSKAGVLDQATVSALGLSAA